MAATTTVRGETKKGKNVKRNDTRQMRKDMIKGQEQWYVHC